MSYKKNKENVYRGYISLERKCELRQCVVAYNSSRYLLQHFNFQLMHTTLKKVELLKHFKIRKTAKTCFGLQGNHHQGVTVST